MPAAKHWRFLGCLVAVGLLGACSGSGGGMTGGDDDGEINCSTDPRAMTYSANMMLPGQKGALKFVLSSSDPAPPSKGNNTWSLKLLDSGGAAVTGADLTVVPFMPDHGHGTSVVPTSTVVGDHYKIEPLYLFMHGIWQVTINVTAGAVTDSAVFDFCVQG